LEKVSFKKLVYAPNVDEFKPNRCLFHDWKSDFGGIALHSIRLHRMLLLQRVPIREAAAVRMNHIGSVHEYSLENVHTAPRDYKKVGAAVAETKNRWHPNGVRWRRFEKKKSKENSRELKQRKKTRENGYKLRKEEKKR